MDAWSIPLPLWVHLIIPWLDAASLVLLGRTCKTFHALTSEESVWKALFVRKHSIWMAQEDANWKKQFLSRSLTEVEHVRVSGPAPMRALIRRPPFKTLKTMPHRTLVRFLLGSAYAALAESIHVSFTNARDYMECTVRDELEPLGTDVY